MVIGANAAKEIDHLQLVGNAQFFVYALDMRFDCIF
jgi:hypothetical protein